MFHTYEFIKCISQPPGAELSCKLEPLVWISAPGILAGWMISGLCGFVIKCPGLVFGKDHQTQVKGGSASEKILPTSEWNRKNIVQQPE